MTSGAAHGPGTSKIDFGLLQRNPQGGIFRQPICHLCLLAAGPDNSWIAVLHWHNLADLRLHRRSAPKAGEEPTGLKLRNTEPCEREGASDTEPCTISCKVARCQAPAASARAATVASWRPSKAIVELGQSQQAASRPQARDGEAKDISAALSRELCQGEEA
eukprot:s972_g8.t1